MAFSDLIDKPNLDRLLLVAIEPKRPNGAWWYDLVLSERYVVAPSITGGDDIFYSGVIDEWGEFGYIADVARCRLVISDGSFRIGLRAMGRGSDGIPIQDPTRAMNISDILSDFELHGARITIAQALEDPTQDTGWIARVIFRGAVVEVSDIGPDGAEIRFVDPSVLASKIPKAEVTRADFPDAPDDTIGRIIPIVYGDFSEKPDPMGYVDNQAWSWFTMSNMAGVPCVCVDTNLSHDTDGPIYRVSCHQLKSFPLGVGAALKEPDVAWPALFHAANWLPINTANYAQVETVWPMECRVGVRCEKPSDDNGCPTSRYAYDLNDESYCFVASGETPLDLHVRSMPRLGTIRIFHVQAWITYATGELRLGLWDPEAADWYCNTPAYTTIPAISAGQDQYVLLECEVSNNPVQTWDTSKFTVRIEALSGVAWVKEIGIKITYAPNRAEARLPHKDTTISPYQKGFGLGRGFAIPNVYPAENQAVYAYCEGHKDDPSGTYTGSANALIANGADIAHHMLVEFGKMTTDDIETSGEIGDFEDARTELGSYHNLALHIGEREPPIDIFSRLCQECRAFPVYNSHGRLGMVAIDPTPAANYRGTGGDVYYWEPGRDFYADTFRCGRTPLDDLAHRVFIEFDYCYMTDRFRRTAYITQDGTDNGFGTDDDSGRKTLAGYGENRFGEGGEFRLKAFDVRRQGVAKALRNFYFDSLWRPRVWGEFECGVHACDLSVGNVIAFGVETINRIVVPSPDTEPIGWDDYSWYVESVIRVEQADDVSRYLVRFVEAIEPETPADWIAAADDS